MWLPDQKINKKLDGKPVLAIITGFTITLSVIFLLFYVFGHIMYSIKFI